MARKFFDRSDWVVTQVLVIASALVYPALTMVPEVIRWISGRPLLWTGTVRAVGPEIAGAAAGPARVTYADQVVWTIPGASTGQWLGSLLVPLVTSVAIGIGAVIVLQLMTRARSGQPFGRESVRLLRALGVVTIGYAAVSLSLPIFSGMVVVGPIDTGGIMAGIISLWALLPFLIGMLIFVLAECFAVGTALRDDVEGLV